MLVGIPELDSSRFTVKSTTISGSSAPPKAMGTGPVPAGSETEVGKGREERERETPIEI